MAKTKGQKTEIVEKLTDTDLSAINQALKMIDIIADFSGSFNGTIGLGSYEYIFGSETPNPKDPLLDDWRNNDEIIGSGDLATLLGYVVDENNNGSFDGDR